MAVEAPDLVSIRSVPPAAWRSLSEKRIFFGHQSVGQNILDGMRDIMKENRQINLRIVDTSSASDFDSPVFAHSRVGKNGDPKSKIDAFAEYMQKGSGGKFDIALLKFCYDDFSPKTDVQGLFDAYRSTMAELRRRYPNTTFVHLTSPLTTVQTGLKAWVRRVVGKPVGGYEENVMRGEFNNLLRKAYQGKEPVFDLAAIESTFPDGKKASLEAKGATYSSLVPEYTDDGGHLNALGRRVVAEQLLVFLSQLE